MLRCCTQARNPVSCARPITRQCRLSSLLAVPLLATSPLHPSPSRLGLLRNFSTQSTRGITPRWKTYGLVADGQGVSTRCQSKDGHIMNTDLPKATGGANTAPQPVYHLLTALVGCKQATAVFVARHMKLRFRGIHFELKAVRDERGALTLPIDAMELPAVSRLQRITGHAYVDTEASVEQLELLKRQVEKRCPVANMIHSSGCELDIVWCRASEHDIDGVQA